jgi:hypothetical protein
MSYLPHDPHLFFGESAVYRITVQGYITDSLVECLGEMVPASRSHKQTILVGSVKDQAELNGLLNTLVERHFCILSVEFLTPGKS